MKVYIGTYEQVLPYLRGFKWRSGSLFEDRVRGTGLMVYILDKCNEIMCGNRNFKYHTLAANEVIVCGTELSSHKIGKYYD